MFVSCIIYISCSSSVILMFLAMTNSSFREWLPIILGNNYMKLVSRQSSLLMGPWCLMILVTS